MHTYLALSDISLDCHIPSYILRPRGGGLVLLFHMYELPHDVMCYNYYSAWVDQRCCMASCMTYTPLTSVATHVLASITSSGRHGRDSGMHAHAQLSRVYGLVVPDTDSRVTCSAFYKLRAAARLPH